MIKAIIFDWHGVLDRTRYEDLISIISELTHKSREYVKETISPFERSYAAGLISPDHFWSSVQSLFKVDDIQMTLLKNSILVVRKNYELWEKLELLGKLYQFAILSDCPLDKVQKIRNEVSLSDFRVVHFSSEAHLLKNSDSFFTNVCTELGFSSSECLYVDDSFKHIQTAQRLGFRICHFKTTEDLNVALKKQAFKK
jgi:glucose-1-phosphatase